jgi:hypothetical protein
MLVTNPALGFRESRPKKGSTYVVGIWGVLRDKGKEK